MDNNQTQDAQSVTQEAADLLEEYASYVRTVKADDLERHPYLPEIERVASKLRLASQPTSAEDAVAWMYEKPDDGRPYIHDRLLRDYKDAIAIANGWTETPLYTRPTPDTSAEDADADNTPHSFDWGAPGTCRKCGNGPAHPVHTPDTTSAIGAEAMRETLLFVRKAIWPFRMRTEETSDAVALIDSTLDELTQPVAAPQAEVARRESDEAEFWHTVNIDGTDANRRAVKAAIDFMRPRSTPPQPEGGTVAKGVVDDLAAELRTFAMNMRRDDSDAHEDLRFYYEAIEGFADRFAALQPEKTK